MLPFHSLHARFSLFFWLLWSGHLIRSELDSFLLFRHRNFRFSYFLTLWPVSVPVNILRSHAYSAINVYERSVTDCTLNRPYILRRGRPWSKVLGQSFSQKIQYPRILHVDVAFCSSISSRWSHGSNDQKGFLRAGSELLTPIVNATNVPSRSLYLFHLPRYTYTPLQRARIVPANESKRELWDFASRFGNREPLFNSKPQIRNLNVSKLRVRSLDRSPSEISIFFKSHATFFNSWHA